MTGPAHDGDPGGWLYVGRVMHCRLRPFRLRFSYRVFTLCVDLDALPTLGRRVPWFGYNKWAPVAFHDRDHGPGDGRPLRAWVESELAARGLTGPWVRIQLVGFPRMLGYAFDPITLYHCYRPNGALGAMLYEVHNTHGERHVYALPVAPDSAAGRIEHGCDKDFYVSPFIGETARYSFVFRAPDERLAFAIRERDPDGDLLVATLTGRRVAMTGRNILRAFFGHPAMTWKVIVAIHWQALRLWWRGAPVHRHGPASQGNLEVRHADTPPAVPAE